METELADNNQYKADDIAIVGMAGRFPGSPDIAAFWRNLKEGVESVRWFSEAELRKAGVDPALLSNPAYVRARAMVEGADLFDAEFFGLTPREAEISDPQQRLLLECAWDAMENSGYGGVEPGPTGVFVSALMNAYLPAVLSRSDLVESAGLLRIYLGNDRDHFATWISYKLNLTGPSATVQTACSSSLVAVHMACQSLLTYQCDMALAGGVNIGIPQMTGYLYQLGGILSRDGHCRAFDAAGSGSVPGEGAGVVVLRRLQDALNSGDPIRAVIKGSAVNNDGARRVGFTAPSVEGQAEVVAMAHAMAEVQPSEISYIETHGSGTSLGDPVEVAALARAFHSDGTGATLIGSVKTNIGHAGAAAGVAGLIKTVLSLENEMIPPSLHFEKSNPEIDFGATPFHVNNRLAPWPRSGQARFAGVSSFGLGGTNAHLVLQEAPERKRRVVEPCTGYLLTISAQSRAALQAATRRLSEFLAGNPDTDLKDVAYTLQVGRRRFDYRRVVVCNSREEAIESLSALNPENVFSATEPLRRRELMFLFPGVGDHYPGMARDLYEQEPTFRAAIDECSAILAPELGQDIRKLLLPPRENSVPRAGSNGLDLKLMLSGRNKSGATHDGLDRVSIVHAAVFIVEYALARMWQGFGLTPRGLLGYSLGEYVCACLAGVFELRDVLKLVVERGRLIEKLPAGLMLAVPLAAEKLSPWLNPQISLSGLCEPALTVVAGAPQAVEELETTLARENIVCKRLASTHALHSWMMTPAAGDLAALVARFRRRPPQIPYVSNVTGQWITPEQAASPEYWAEHLCKPVRFSEGLRSLCAGANAALLEVGPGQMLTSLAMQIAGHDPLAAIPSLRPAYESQSDLRFAHGALAKLWLAGVEVNWAAYHKTDGARRIALPSYPFQRKRYSVDTSLKASFPAPAAPFRDWQVLAPQWRQIHSVSGSMPEGPWLVATRDSALAAQLRRVTGSRVVNVQAAKAFQWIDGETVEIDPEEPGQVHQLFSSSAIAGEGCLNIVLDAANPSHDGRLFALMNGVRIGISRPLNITVLLSGARDISGADAVNPEQALRWGACLQFQEEVTGVAFRAIDIAPGMLPDTDSLRNSMIKAWESRDAAIVALRGRRLWSCDYVESAPERNAASGPTTYVVLGAGTVMGSEIVAGLASRSGSRVVCIYDEGEPQPPAERPAAGDVLDVVLNFSDDDEFQNALATIREQMQPFSTLLYCSGSKAEAHSSVHSAIPEAIRALSLAEQAGAALQVSHHVVVMSSADRIGESVMLSLIEARNQSAQGRWMALKCDAVPEGGVMCDILAHVMGLRGSSECIVRRSASGAVIEPSMPAEGEEAVDVRSGELPGAADGLAETETEAVIIDIWRRILGTGRIGVNDNFFRLGGNSLLGLQVTSELRRAFSVDLHPHVLLQFPAIVQLAQHVEDLILLQIEQGDTNPTAQV